MSDSLVFFVNGKKVEDENVDPEWTLLQYLREKLGLPGTKLACGEGGCGACTVMLSRIERRTGAVRHLAINACLAPVVTVHGMAVTTTEGIGSTRTRLHPVQERIAMTHGSQCGFCTPGFVMSMYTLLRNNPSPSMEEIEETLVGNLCRCTGYRPILEGFRTFAQEGDVPNGCGRSDCCQLKSGDVTCVESGASNGGGNSLERTPVLYDAAKFRPYDPSQEIIFPPELKMMPELDTKSLVFKGRYVTFYRPVDLTQLLLLKKAHPEAKIVAGNTEVGVETRFKFARYSVIIHPSHVAELHRLEVTSTHVKVGSALPLSSIESAFKKIIKEQPAHKTKVLVAILQMLKWFAGRQIRNVASLGGNIITGSPISDLNPIFIASGSKLVFNSVEGEREIEFDRQFYTGYRKNIAKPNEVLVSIKIPFTSKNEYFEAFKQSRRKDDDIAIVNAAFRVLLEPKILLIKTINIAFGGMAPTTICAEKTMKALRGRIWDEELLEAAITSLLAEMKLDTAVPGGMARYRTALTSSFFFKFYLSVRNQLHAEHPNLLPSLKKDELDLISEPEPVPIRSMQFFQNVPEGQEKIDPVGRPLTHVSATKQASGEAEFIDDIPPFINELKAAFVFSSRPHANILRIDPSEALKMEGVRGFFTAEDIPGENSYGQGILDDEFMASGRVRHIGQVVGVVVANDFTLAREAARAVRVDYQDLPDPVFTIDEALEANSIFDSITVEDGDVEGGFKDSAFVLEGETYIGGQEHFYMETNVHIAIPHDGGEMELLSSSQNISDNQFCVARALGLGSHLVTCRVKRIGGGFGGKETRTVTACVPAAVAAYKLRCPVRVVLERDEDMVLTGGRHPYLGRWKAGFQKDGTLTSVRMNLYSNGGYSYDLSKGVRHRAVFTAENVYKIKNIQITGTICRTNLPSNTAFRGFGTPQSCFVMEDIMAKVSDFLQISPLTVRGINMCKEGDRTFYGQKLAATNLRRCWKEAIENWDYHRREKAVGDFNKKNRYKKRGISVIPIKFGIGFGANFLNQCAALVLIYVDGTVLITHGGIEMGQGVHTKLIQIAARALGIPATSIHISETSTDKVPNASPSAASATSDLNGMAILNACNELMTRLEPFRKKNPKGQWKDWVKAAYFNKVNLMQAGFYKFSDSIGVYDKEKDENNFFQYFTYGASISEVEVDCLTGHHDLLRTDIMMDLGTSLNPAIDVGQIEGAFMQGRGLCTMEQLVYSRSGALITKGPGAYKIPSVQDIPREFNVSLLRDSSNPRAIYSSKAVGEPPLFAGFSVFFALREAIKATRQDKPENPLNLYSPLTAERIRMACKDYISDKIPSTPEKEANKSWSLDI